MATMTQGPGNNKSLLQHNIDWLAENDPAALEAVGTQSNPLPTGDEVRLSSMNNYLLAGSQDAMDRVSSGQQAPPVPYAVGSDGKVVGWTPQAGSVTYATPPAGFAAADPSLTANWQREPLTIPQVTWTPPPSGGTGGTVGTGGTGGTGTVGTGGTGTVGTGGTGGTGGSGGTDIIQIGDPLQQVAQANTTGANTYTINPGLIERATAQNATAANAGNASTWAGQGYGAQNATAANAGNASLAGTTTVQGLLGQIMAQDSPLMQQARTQSQQQMASRGLLNSSMAIGAGQDALYRTAMPIAQSDAAALNTTSQYNAGARNQMQQYNASNQQQTNLANQNAQNQASQFGADARNQSASQNAQASNQMQQYNASNQQQTSLANAQSANSASQFNAGNQFSAQQANMQAQNQGSQFNAQQQNAQNQFNASQTNEVLRSQMEFENRTELANIEANYKTLMQMNQSAGELYQQTIKNITDISTNKDMDAATKTTAINNQMTYLQAGMGLFQTMNNMTGLDTILNFETTYPIGDLPAPAEVSAPSTPSAPAPSAPAPVYEEPFRDAQ